ncbi:MAG: hypothetical protein J7K88_09735 [Candidatus Fermentibacteraceae bacterium]|nr:hypothetical protein [Candidatus Fermentibacteraceae bacterium]
MRTAITILILLTAVSFAEEFNRHSFSIAFIPYPEIYMYPDVTYEYALSKNNAIGLSTTLGVVNRFAYTRKIGSFRLAAGIGYASANLDIVNATTLYTLTAEYRQSIENNFYTKLVAGGILFDNAIGSIPWAPILQLGFGYGF